MTALTFYIQSDLKDYGWTEDGEKFIGEVYYIVAQDKFGNRWAHHHSFDGVKVETSDWGISFGDVREDAQKDANRLMDRIVAANLTSVANRPHWSETRPEYGSDAYIAYGQADDLAWERKQG